MPFAEKLSKLRNNKGLTQKDMAKMAGVGIAQLRRYEGGKSSPTLEVIKRIAIGVGVSADELIFDENEGPASVRILDKKLLEQFELVSKLSPCDKESIKTVLESIVLKSRLEEILPVRKDEAWSKEMRNVLSEFRQGAAGYLNDEIDNMVDEAVKAVRAEEKPGRGHLEA